jgi:large subunit ribosomal protein L35
MPKMKTHSGAKKRFTLTATGKVRGRHAFTSHILEKKSAKHKRQLGEPALLSPDDTPRVKRMLNAPSNSHVARGKAARPSTTTQGVSGDQAESRR